MNSKITRKKKSTCHAKPVKNDAQTDTAETDLQESQESDVPGFLLDYIIDLGPKSYQIRSSDDSFSIFGCVFADLDFSNDFSAFVGECWLHV